MSRDRLIVRRRIGDIETPVSAMLKLGPDQPGSFLFESIPLVDRHHDQQTVDFQLPYHQQC